MYEIVKMVLGFEPSEAARAAPGMIDTLRPSLYKSAAPKVAAAIIQS